MHFDTTLNLAWVLLGLIALAATLRAKSYRQHARANTRNRTRSKPGRGKWLRLVGVAVVVTALFPYVSATDDVLRIDHFTATQQQHDKHTNKQTKTDDLIRLYEAMDSPLVCRVSEIALTFCFVSLILAPVVRQIDRKTPFEAGRSPPAFAIA